MGAGVAVSEGVAETGRVGVDSCSGVPGLQAESNSTMVITGMIVRQRFLNDGSMMLTGMFLALSTRFAGLNHTPFSGTYKKTTVKGLWFPLVAGTGLEPATFGL
jgi:hypothetical protein